MTLCYRTARSPQPTLKQTELLPVEKACQHVSALQASQALKARVREQIEFSRKVRQCFGLFRS